MDDLFTISDLQILTTSISDFTIGFLLAVILSIILKYIYLKYSNSVSNKSLIANIFPIFTVAIFLIVITIKSSLVLSLGLVGALSIIRFRTAIKEAEQIVYFLVLTAIAIACAANSFLFPVVLVFFIFAYTASQFIFREWFVDLETSILLMVTTGITATLAFLLLFSAYSIASPSVVSPFEYSILLWSSLIGWFYFNEIPSLTTGIGILIIVSSGIYIFVREKAQDQSIATEKPLR